MRKLGHWLKRQGESIVGMAALMPILPGALVDYYSLPRNDPRRRGSRQQLSEAALGTLWLLGTLLVAAADRFSDPGISFILFYLLIAGFAAWTGGRKVGLLVTLAGSLFSFIDDSRLHPGLTVLYANLGIQLVSSLFIILLVSAVHDLIVHLDQRSRERMLALEREIVDRRQTEAQLLKTMQQLRQLAENISDAFWMRDATESRIVYASPAFEHIWGRPCLAAVTPVALVRPPLT